MKSLCIKIPFSKSKSIINKKTKFENKLAIYSNGSEVSGKKNISFALRGC